MREPGAGLPRKELCPRGWFGVLGILLPLGGCSGAGEAGIRGPDSPGGAVEISTIPVAGRERVRIEVLNAGGRRDMARSATALLRDAGFDVVYFGNDRGTVDSSEVVIRLPAGSGVARSVGAVLGIDRVREEPDSTLLLELSVRIGPDWGPASPGEVDGPESGPGEEAGEDPARETGTTGDTGR